MTDKDQTPPARRFPILGDRTRKIRSVDWEVVDTVRDQIEANHGRTVEELAAVGGLTARELLAALRGERYHGVLMRRSLAEVEEEIVDRIGQEGGKE